MSSTVAATLSVPSLVAMASPPAGLQVSQTVGRLEGLDHWLKGFQKYEVILAEMASASADIKFNDELATIEQWFKVLSEPERTASVYTLLQHSTQEQTRFFMAVLQQMIKSEERAPDADVESKPKNAKTGLRPPSLNIPLPRSPATPALVTSRGQDSTPVLIVDSSSRLGLPKLSARASSPTSFLDNSLRTPAADGKSWASMVNTPLVPMFQKPDVSRNEVGNNVSTGVAPSGNNGTSNKGPGLAAINPATLNLLAGSGLSNEAQLLAVQLVMSGILQPADIVASQNQPPPPSAAKHSHKKASTANWRAPSGARYPGSALRNGGSKSSGQKNTGGRGSGAKSSSLDNVSAEPPKVDDFNPELLNDIPAWLRSLRLHKYTACFEGMTWQEMVVLDDAILEKQGIAALGARRRLLRTFDRARREMGMIDAMPNTSVDNSNDGSTSDNSVSGEASIAAQGATKLSADSPVFMPAGQVPHCAASVVTPPSVITSVV